VTGPTVTRREALKLAALATLGPSFARSGFAQDRGAEPRFFTQDDLQIVDALAERVIPADAHSPGAQGAQVARWIDAMLAEADPVYPEDAEIIESWRRGLDAARAANRELHSGEILEGTPEQHDALLGRLSSEAQKDSAEGAFLSLLKEWTVFAYYTSEIGIHRELGYQGNTVLEEFAGQLPSGPARSEPGA